MKRRVCRNETNRPATFTAAVFSFTPHGTAPHRTAPHRTAPHRTAPHRTAPHRTAPHRMERQRNAPHLAQHPAVPGFSSTQHSITSLFRWGIPCSPDTRHTSEADVWILFPEVDPRTRDLVSKNLSFSRYRYT